MRVNFRRAVSGWITVCFLLTSSWVQAGMIGTEQMVSESSRSRDLATVEAFMAGGQVQARLQDWGVDAQQAAERVAQLSDAELQELAMNIEAEPAGGDALAVVGIVFLVLLILELLGVTNVFTAI